MKFDYKKAIKPDLNVGDREQKQRLLAGTALVFVSIFAASIILLLVGLVLIATGYFGRCPVYAGINRNTLGKDATVAATETGNKKPEVAVEQQAAVATSVAQTKVTTETKPATENNFASKTKPTKKIATSIIEPAVKEAITVSETKSNP